MSLYDKSFTVPNPHEKSVDELAGALSPLLFVRRVEQSNERIVLWTGSVLLQMFVGIVFYSRYTAALRVTLTARPGELQADVSSRHWDLLYAVMKPLDDAFHERTVRQIDELLRKAAQ